MRKTFEKKIAWLLSFVLLLSLAVTSNVYYSKAAMPTGKGAHFTGSFSYDASNGTEAPNNWGFSVEFYSDSACTNFVADVPGFTYNKDNTSIAANVGSLAPTANYIKFTFVTAGTPVKSAKINGTDVVISDSVVLPMNADGITSFNIQIVLQKNNGGNGGGGQNNNTVDIPVVLTDDDHIVGAVTVDNEPINNGIAKAPQNPANGKRRIAIAMNDFSHAIAKATINGVVFENDTIPPEDQGWYIFEVADAASYTIEIVRGEPSHITMVWAYDENSKYYNGEDTLVSHGKVELVSITRDLPGLGDTVIYEDGDEMSEVDVSDEGGYVMLEKGDDVVVKIIPDYGYQLKSVTINDMTLVPQEGVSTFKLPDIEGNLHFSGAFVKTEDVVKDNSTLVTSAKISGGANAATSGNLSLTVEDNKNYTKDVTTAVKGDSTVVASLDLTLDNIVSKGNGTNWTSNITEFAKPIDVSITLDDITLADGETITVVRDHNGTLTELEATYDASTKTLTFPTNQFSTYTIVKVKKLDSNVKTGDHFDTRAWLLLAISCIGLIVVEFKKRKLTQ